VRAVTDRAQLQATINKPVDSWWTVLVIDPIAVRVVPLLVPLTWVTPNGITLVALGLGLGAGAALLWGPLWVGAVLFQLRFLFDCLDGKLARARGAGSARGAALDLTTDVVTITWCYAALALRVVEAGAAPPALVAAVVGTANVFAWVLLYRKTLPDPPPREGGASGWAAALERRRLMSTPIYSVEAEIVSLSLVPLFGDLDAAAVALWVVVGFYAAATAVNMLRVWRRATAVDERR
jgi:phosphatidylglycerophosphate synthase